MRASMRLRAEASRFLSPFAPTGLAGLRTHPNPRSELRLLYSQTLDALSQLPASSVYRTATENLTKARLKVISDAVPEDLGLWKQNQEQMLKEHRDDPGRGASIIEANGETFVQIDMEARRRRQAGDVDDLEYGEIQEGVRDEEEIAKQLLRFDREDAQGSDKVVEWEPEPPLTRAQINEVEANINGGLLEEVINVARGELELAQAMQKYKVWETLTEKPPEGQWKYFEVTKDPASA